MSFYDLSKTERENLVIRIRQEILADLKKNTLATISKYFSADDTYIRKAAYLNMGRIYFEQMDLQSKILQTLKNLFQNKDPKVRQTSINACGEIGKRNTKHILPTLEEALNDPHSSVRNAVIGSLKKMGRVNPKPVLDFVRKFLHHPDPKIRREVIHGVELRGRTHPEDVLDILEEAGNETDPRVKWTLIHVLGQISYKKGCLEKVVAHLRHWKNKEVVTKTLAEIIDVHKRYADFSAKTSQEAQAYISKFW